MIREHSRQTNAPHAKQRVRTVPGPFAGAWQSHAVTQQHFPPLTAFSA
jgi:hypothetical protein